MLTAKVIEVGAGQDPIEFCYARGWTDGLPVVPPTKGDFMIWRLDVPRSAGFNRPYPLANYRSRARDFDPAFCRGTADGRFAASV